jgi:sulfatase maturation enzyme AslB (radical SAM superfamily)
MDTLSTRLRHRARQLRARANLPVKWAAYEGGLTRGPFFPDRLYVESTNYCNLRCIMCPTGLGVIARPKGYMDMGLFRRIVDEVAPLAPALVLHSWGEPMMHPELFDMVAYARARDLWVETSTNITLLTEERIRKVLASGMSQLYLAMDGVTKATYERVRVGANFDKVMRNVERLLELKRESGSRLRVVLQIIAMNETREEVREFVCRWTRPEVDQVNVKHLDTWGDQVDAISAHAIEHDRPPVRRPCPNLWYHGYIFWDGSLVSCERDYDVKTLLGNVRDGVLAAWHGEQMRRLREKHVRGDFTAPACANCVEWSWWTPGPFRSAGTAPKVESHERRRRGDG